MVLLVQPQMLVALQGMMEALISKASGIASAAAKMHTSGRGYASIWNVCLGSNVFNVVRLGGCLLWRRQSPGDNGFMFFSFFLVGQQIKALSFTRLTAQQLGERLLRWSGHYGQNYVDSEKVWKCKKKNKGVKRQHWWAAVKEFHNQGGPDGQHLDGSDNQNKPPGDDGLDGAPPSAAPIDKSAMPVPWDFSDAPWNKKPRIEVVEDDKTTKTGAEADRKKEKEDGKSSSSQPEEGKVRSFGP